MMIHPQCWPRAPISKIRPWITWLKLMRSIPVITEVILAAESFVTDVTLVWTFVRVRAFMDQQIVRLCEVSTAEPTDELTPVT